MEGISKEDYLRAVYHLMEEHNEVKSVDLAQYLNVSKPSVSEMLPTLAKKRLINHKKYSKVTLSKRGYKIASNLTMRHRVIETFLKNILNINPNKIHDEAHKLEHAFSNESIEKLKKILGNPKTDPHGKPIPQ